MKKKKKFIIGCAGFLLSGTTAVGFLGWHSEHEKVEALEKQLATMQLEEKRSAVAKSVSTQMEEIANEQREISDEKREEALRQTLVANEMRLRSEVERQNALIAEKNAVASEKRALEASEVAEAQRQMAEHQRIQAEFSKRTADTLSYINLGRSLGSISTIQHQAGNDDVANLLSYASYLFTSRYMGDVYYPSVYQSMMQASQSMSTWTDNVGAIMSVNFYVDEPDKIVTCSNYGEILIYEKNGVRLHTQTLFRNNAYDFRDIYIDKDSKNIYALSRTGQMVVISHDLKSTKVINLDKVINPFKISYINENNLLLVSEKSIALFDMKRNIVRHVKQQPYRIIVCSRKDNLPLIFDDQGNMHLIRGIDNITTQKVPVEGKVTAYCESKNTGFEAYGMNDGTIWLAKKGSRTQKLIGHRSRISKMKLNGRRLYSAAYDGEVNLWITSNEKIEPITLAQTNNWIMSFNFDSSKNTFWMGDVKGNLTAVNISIPSMVAGIKKKLKRDFTQEEWNYFVGKNIPYESFLGKEVAP